MFLSTVVPSTRLNVNTNKGVTPYNFSLPYNFVRGRHLVVSINPENTTYSSWGYSGLRNGILTGDTASEGQNIQHIIIPDSVTEYTTTMDIVGSFKLSGNPQDVVYKIELKFDLVQQIITITPLQYTGTTVTHDKAWTAATLIVISTVL